MNSYFKEIKNFISSNFTSYKNREVSINKQKQTVMPEKKNKEQKLEKKKSKDHKPASKITPISKLA